MPVSSIFSNGARFTNLGLSNRGARKVNEQAYDTAFSPSAINQVETSIREATAPPGIAPPSAKKVSIDSIAAIPDDLAALKATISGSRG